MKKSTLLSAFLFFTLLLFAQASFGVTNYWDGSFNTYWHNNANWSLGHIPLATEDVVITTEGNIPHVDIYSETVNSLLIDPGATLYIAGFTLTVTNNVTISGTLNMSNTLAKLYCKNILWQSGSTATMTGSALISLSGNWEFAAGANVQLTTGYTDFTGTVASNIISRDIDCYFNHIRNFKSGTYLAHSSSSSTDVRINGNLYLYSGSILSSFTSLRIKLNGFLNNTAGTGTIQLNNGAFEFTGGSTTNFLNPGDYFYNLIINSTGTTTIADEVIIKGYLSIVQGTFNTNSNLITIAGNWSNSVGTAGFTEGTGRVIFNGSVQQYVTYGETFNILEVNKTGGALRLSNASATVYCASYDWTLGAVDILSGNFFAASLADNGIAGSWYLNSGGTIDLYNPSGYVDLLGNLYIYGGTMNVWGGIDDSYWPYGVAGSAITMSAGILNFKETGIYVQTSGTLTENITGGNIKTSGNLRLQRSDFTPTNSIFTMNGTENAYIRLDAGSINQLDIAKTSVKTSFSSNAIPDYFSSNTEDDLPASLIDTEYFTSNTVTQTNSNYQIVKQPRDGSKASKVIGDVVTAYANISLNHIVVYSGTFSPNNHTIQLAGDMLILGNLEMTSFWDEINTRDITWYPGSTANVIMGNIYVNRDWYFQNGTNAQLGGINIVNFIGSADLEIQCLDANASFQNVIIDKTSTSLDLTYDEIRVSNNFTLEAGNTFYIIGANGSLIVDGTMEIVSTASMIVDATSSLTTNSAFALNGTLSVAGDAFIHNGFDVNTSGELTISGNLYCDVSPTEWVLMHGILNLNSDGLFEVNGNFSIQNGTSNVSGIIRTSGGFVCNTTNAFKPLGGTVEFFGTDAGYISCNNGNYFHNVLINKPTGYVTKLMDNVVIKNDFTITSGYFWVMNGSISYNMQVGGQWTNNVGTSGFLESSGTVTFNGSAANSVIQTDETFYKLYCEKTGGAILAIKFDQTVTVLNNLDIASGSLFAGSGSTLNVEGNQTIHYNAGLGFSSPGTVLNIGGNWTNNNTSNTGTTGFSCGGSSTVTFNGNTDQTLTTSAPFEGFYNLEIDKISGDLITNDNTEVAGNFLFKYGKFRGNTAGLMHTFYGDFTVELSGWWDASTNFNTVIFAGTADQNYSYYWLALGKLSNVIIDKSAKSNKSEIGSTGDQNISSGNNKSKGGTLNLISSMHLSGIESGLTINSGTLKVIGQTLESGGNITVNTGGILNVNGGSVVHVGNTKNLNINGGLLNSHGTSTLKNYFYNSQIGGYFSMHVYNGGTISAEYVDFRDLGGNGLFVDSDGLIDPLYPLNNCSFLQGKQSNLVSYLKINNSQNLTIDSVKFEDGTITAKNVTKSVNQGDLLFTNASGYFSGPTFENDAFDRIDWTGFTPGLWTGSVSNDWGDYRNWDDYAVPDNTVDVLIPAGIMNPLISDTPKYCKSITISAGASLTLHNNSLTVTNNVDIYGKLFMYDGLGTLNIGQNIIWRPGSETNVSAGNITIGGNWNFMNGTFAQLGFGNTITFNGGGDQYITCADPDAELGTLVCNKTSGTLRTTTILTDTIRVVGNMTVNGSNTCRIQTGSLIVDGTLYVKNTANLFAESGTSIISNSFLDVNGNLSVYGDVFVYTQFSMHGNLNMYVDGLLEIHASVQIPVGAMTNIEGGTIRISGHLDASIPNTFQPTGGTVEFFGPMDTHIQCYNNNYFNNLIINKDINTLIYINHDIAIKNDFTINSGVFRAFAGISSYNMEVGGNWTNNVGEGGFLEEEGTVTFNGNGPSSIFYDETFYNLNIEKYSNPIPPLSYGILYIQSGISVTVLNNVTLIHGPLYSASSSLLDVRGNLEMMEGSKYSCDITSSTDIYIKGNWTNNNNANIAAKGFAPGNSTVTFNGSGQQLITSNAPFDPFNNLVIDKTADTLKSNDNLQVLGDFSILQGTVQDKINGLSHEIFGNIHVEPGGFWNSKVTLTTVNILGDANQLFTNNSAIPVDFYNIIINKPDSSFIIDNGFFRAENTTIDGGTLLLNDQSIASKEIIINDGGIFTAYGNATINLGAENSFQVFSGGTLEMIGSYGHQILFRCYNNYLGTALEVNSGGTIRAKYVKFQDLLNPGIIVHNGATIDPAYAFTNCILQSAVGAGAVLSIHTNQTLVADSVTFNTSTGGSTANVYKAFDLGHITFTNASGYFAGPTFEDDPYDRIDWTGFTPGLWTGAASNYWGDYRNWDNLAVPDATVDVIIPTGVPNYPVVDYLPQSCNNLIINAGASLTIHDEQLAVSGNLNNYGLLAMDDPLSNLTIGQNMIWWPGSSANASLGFITIGGNWNFMDGTTAQLGAGNTTTFNGGGDQYITCDDADAELGSLVCSKTSSTLRATTILTDTVRVSGNLTVNATNTFNVETGNLIVDGILDIKNTAHMEVVIGTSLTNNSTFGLNGSLIVDGDAFIHNNFSVNNTGELSVTGNFILDNSTLWNGVDGILNINNGGLFEVNSSLGFGPTAIVNITDGNINISNSFQAIYPNSFEQTGGVIEFFGPETSTINCIGNNYFNNMVINKNPGVLTYLLGYDIVIKNDFTINSGVFRASDGVTSFNMEVGGNWTNYVGEAGFLEEQGTVTFNGDGNIQYVSSETFYNVQQDYVAPGSNLQFMGTTTVQNNMTLNYRTWINDNCTINGNLDISNPASKFSANLGATGTISNLLQGGTMTINGGTITVDDLAENGIYGTINIISGELNYSQDVSSFVDLNCDLTMSGGTFNVNSTNDNSLWTFDGNASVTMSDGILNFNNCGVIIQDNTNTFTENITGGTIRTDGFFMANRSQFTPSGGTLEMFGGADVEITTVPGANLYNVLINKSGGKQTTTIYKDRNGNMVKAVMGNMVNVISDISINGNLTVDAGQLYDYSHSIACLGNVNINNSGLLSIDANGTLALDNLKTLSVNSGGTLSVIGNPGNEARITHLSGYYNFNIDSGGTIAAEYGVFEYMNINGIYLKPGSIVNPANSFNNCLFREGINGGRLITANTENVFTATNAVFPTNTWGSTHNVYKSAIIGSAYFVGATGGFAGEDFDYDPYNLIHWSDHVFTLDLTINLEGAFNGTAMNSGLNNINLLPLSQPYNAAPWNYTGSESVPTIPNNSIIDWVIVDGRDAPNAAAATVTSTFDRQAAFLLADGSIVGIDGVSPIQFTHNFTDQLFVVITHRNHLSILSANPIIESGGVYAYDYSSGANQVYGGAPAHKELVPGVWGMMSGDVNADGTVNSSDKTAWTTQAGKTLYNQADLNMDGNIDNQDKNDFWLPNYGKSTMLP